MKKVHLPLLILPMLIWAQQHPPLNQMEQFISRVGPTVNFENYYLPGLQSANGKFIYAKLRKVTGGNESQYFLILSAKDKNASNSGILSERDLTEILNHLLILQSTVKNGADQSDYRESRYVTPDWFQIGCAYNAYEQKILWSIILERDDDATFFFHSPDDLEKNLTAALKMIETLKHK